MSTASSRLVAYAIGADPRSTLIEPRNLTLPDVAVVDVHLPDGGGRAIIAAVLAEWPEAVFLALSVSDSAEDVVAVIRAGARGYVTKTINANDLIDAIHRVHDGDAVFSPRLAGIPTRRSRRSCICRSRQWRRTCLPFCANCNSRTATSSLRGPRVAACSEAPGLPRVTDLAEGTVPRAGTIVG